MPANLDIDILRTLATARGALGTSADYLFSTAAHLEQLGIGDHTLEHLCAEVRAYRLADGKPQA